MNNEKDHPEPHRVRQKHLSCLRGESEERDKGSIIESFATNFSNIYESELLPARNGEKFTEHFLHEVVDILLSYIKKTYDGKSKVLDFHHPHQLLEGLEGFSVELSDQPQPLEQILVDCRDTLKYGVKTVAQLHAVIVLFSAKKEGAGKQKWYWS
ncbi:UNVERIFIED_CONTAM: glutamate decarboxylase gad1 [Gekko kuhli]